METALFLAEASRAYDSFFFVLFLSFAIAAIVWLILWIFSNEGGESSGTTDTSEGTKSIAASIAEKSTAPEPASKTLEGDAEKKIVTEEKAVVVPKSPPKKKSPAKKAAPVTSPADEVEGFEAASEEEAASLFASELAEGSVTQDPVYGIIYKDAPAEVDDLKKIKGIAKVLEGKLNGIGVYQFRQVAVWTPAACEEFSKMLTFKKRIYTDNWLAQAKDFHEQKYGEKL